MKTKTTKYEEAIERNLYKPEKGIKAKYAGLSLESAKMKLGIRANDGRYDERVMKLIKK